MITLQQYINDLIFEGGQSGHMSHIIDYDEFTRDDLIELVSNLFDGKIEDITEKIDGTNICPIYELKSKKLSDGFKKIKF